MTPSPAETRLRTAIRDKSFQPVYYFYGDDEFEKERTARELIAAAVDVGDRDFNQEIIRGAEVSAEALDLALATPPMFAARRAVLVRDVHALAKAARAVLESYLRRPAADLLLVLMAPPGQKPEASLAGQADAMEFAPRRPEQIPRWIVEHTHAALGADITPSAARLLQDAIGSDVAQLASELDKLASYTAGRPITDDAIAAVVGAQRGESLGDLIDAVTDRDPARAAQLVGPVLAQPRTSVVTILMALTTQLLAIGWGRTLLDGGARPAALEREYYALLRESRVYPGRSWGEAISSWVRGARAWSAAAIDTALAMLLVADHAAKETRLSSDEQLVTAVVLGLCAAGQGVGLA